MNCLPSWLLFVALLLNPVIGFAETVSIGRLPLKPGKAGFVMDIAMEPVSGNGYQPFHLKFIALGTGITHDRNLTVIIEPRNYSQTTLDLTYQKSITLPEGVKSHSVPIYIPHYVEWDQIYAAILEDGRQIETGKNLFSIGNTVRTQFAKQKVSVGIIVAEDAEKNTAPWAACPDVRTLNTVLGEGPIPGQVKTNRLNHQSSMKIVESVQPCWVQYRPYNEEQLPEHWFAYSQLDVMIVAAPVLARIEKQHPERFKSLKQWLVAGGNLWTYATKTKADNTAPSSAFLESLKTTPQKKTDIVPQGKSRSWLNLNSENDTSDLVYESWNGGVQKSSQHYSYQSSIKLEKRSTAFKKLKTNKHPFTKDVPASEIAKQLRVGTYGMGSVLSISSEDPFPGSFQFWQSVSNIHKDIQLSWTERMGIDVPSGNDNYWTWLIPSVGKPPVKSFVLLNTLFAILVGPVCYFFFRRRDRLYLLYFAAPCMALIVTMALFVYALSADGTKTKVRSRQITWLDPTNQCSVGQSRQTYYAVLGRKGGIQFSGDAAVYPVQNVAAVNRYYRRHGRSGRRGGYTAENGVQNFDGKFLPPRDQVQYLATLPKCDDTSSVMFLGGATPKSVTHNFPVTIHRLIACDQNGKYWEASNVVPNENVALAPSDKPALKSLITKDVLPPLESVPMLQQNTVRAWTGQKGTGVQVSALETRLEDWSKKLPKGTFIGIADRIDDQIGVDGASVLNSVHVVMGEIQ